MALNFTNCKITILRNDPILQKENPSPIFEGDAYVEPSIKRVEEYSWPIAPLVTDEARILDQWMVNIGNGDLEEQSCIIEPGDIITVTDVFVLNGVYIPIISPMSYTDDDTNQDYTEVLTIRTRKI